MVCAWGRRSSCCDSALGSIGVWSQSPRDATTRRHVIGSPLAFGAPRGGHVVSWDAPNILWFKLGASHDSLRQLLSADGST